MDEYLTYKIFPDSCTSRSTYLEMKKPKSMHSGTADLRQKIISTALACFTENGYTDTGIGDICSRSGISVGSLYHHFKSKEQLARAIYIEGIKNYQSGFTAGLAECSSAKAGIYHIVKYHLNWVKQSPDYARFLFMYRHAGFMTGSENDITMMNNELHNTTGAWFSEQVKKKEIRKMSVGLYLCLLLGPCQEYSRLYLSGKTGMNMEKEGDEIASIMWKSLRHD